MLAMAMHYLGETIDLHAGGVDLIFPIMKMKLPEHRGYRKNFCPLLHAGYLNMISRKCQVPGQCPHRARLLENSIVFRFHTFGAPQS